MRVLVILALLCGIAEAHPLDTAYLRVESHGSIVEITFDLDVALAAQELKVEPGAIDGVLAARGEELAGKLYRTHAPASTEPCDWGRVAPSRKGVTVTLRDHVTCRPGTVHWDLSFGKRLAATFQILGKVIDDDGERVITIDKTTTSLTIASGHSISFGGAIEQGLETTGILPAGWKRGHPAALELLLLLVVLLAGARGLLGQARDVGALIAGIMIGGLVGSPALWDLAPLPLVAVLVATAISVALRTLERHRWILAALGGVLEGMIWHEPQQPIGYAIGLSLGAVVVLVLLGSLLGFLQRASMPRWVVPVIALVAGVAGAVYVMVSAG